MMFKTTRCRLIDIIDLFGGGTPKTNVPEYWNGGIPWLSVKDFCNDNRYVYSSEKTITQMGVTNSSTKVLDSNDMQNVIRHTPDPSWKRCAFTGYRPAKMPFGNNEDDPHCKDFKQRLRNTIEMLIQQNYRHFISGGAMGMDTFAAEAVLDLKKDYPEITLEMVSPFDGQADKWTESYRLRHDQLFEQADMVTATAQVYTKSCMFIRNRYLVTNADILLAAFDGQPGGTAMTVDYAKRMGVQVLLIPPTVVKQTRPTTVSRFITTCDA